MKITTSRVQLPTLNETQRVDLFAKLKAFIHFDFERQSEWGFKAVHNGLSQISIVPDQVLHNNKTLGQEYIGKIKNFEDFYGSCTGHFQGKQYAQSFYN